MKGPIPFLVAIRFLNIELALNRLDAGLGAGFVGIASRCSGHANCTDQ
jgi:hypothetical protein